MGLTKNEMEAKIEALEERLSLLTQTTDGLEQQFEHATVRWAQALAAIGRQLDQMSKQGPLPPK